MNISYNWLKSYIPQIPAPKELEHLLTFHVTEIEEVKELDTDTIFDLKILPDRAGDLLSHLGVAREISGLLGIPFVDPTPQYKIPESQETKLEINIDSQNCPRYTGRIVRNFKVGPSPVWVVKYLAAIGERSINNIVDASNIVMYDCGQPTHAFDLKKISSEKIIIKDANTEEDFPVVGSDNIVVKIKEGDLVICDQEKIIALAGIKGGTNSGIGIDAPYTTDILIEVAHFDATRIRKTGQRLGLYSDARKRFENNVPLELIPYAMREFSALLLEMCPDAVFEDIIDVGQKEQDKKTISFTTDIISEKLGVNLTPADIAVILQNYHYGYVEEQGNFVVHIPYWRQDITGIHDMVDEIGRVYGYDKVIPIMPEFPKNQKHDQIYLKIKAIKNYFLNIGYSEVMSYSFSRHGDIEVLKGLKNKSKLRKFIAGASKSSGKEKYSQTPGGIELALETARLNKELFGLNHIKIFEIGNIFHKENNIISEHVECSYVSTAPGPSKGFFHIIMPINKKDNITDGFDEFIQNNNIKVSEIDLSKYSKVNTQFKMWSEYPFITRDIAFWVSSNDSSDDVLKILQSVKSEYIVRGPELFDSFSKDGKTSYAFRIVFQSYERTLTDEDIQSVMDNMYMLVKEKGWEIR